MLKITTKSGAGSSKARKCVCSDQLRFLSKLVDRKQTAGSLSVENMEETQFTTAEQDRDDINNFSQETLVRPVENRNV